MFAWLAGALVGGGGALGCGALDDHLGVGVDLADAGGAPLGVESGRGREARDLSPGHGRHPRDVGDGLGRGHDLLGDVAGVAQGEDPGVGVDLGLGLGRLEVGLGRLDLGWLSLGGMARGRLELGGLGAGGSRADDGVGPRRPEVLDVEHRVVLLGLGLHLHVGDGAGGQRALRRHQDCGRKGHRVRRPSFWVKRGCC